MPLPNVIGLACQNVFRGDNVLTARSIATQCGGIFTEGGIIMDSEGPVSCRLNQQDRMEIVPWLQVLVRSSPDNKKTLVETLEEDWRYCWCNWALDSRSKVYLIYIPFIYSTDEFCACNSHEPSYSSSGIFGSAFPSYLRQE